MQEEDERKKQRHADVKREIKEIDKKRKATGKWSQEQHILRNNLRDERNRLEKDIEAAIRE